MSNFVGMDVAAVNRLSLDLKAAADRLTQITTEVERIVHLTTGQWDGHDADDFRQWWSGQHRPKMMAAASAIGGLSQSATNNAGEQAHASGGGAVGTAAVVVGGGVVVAPAATPAVTPSPSGAAGKVAAFASRWEGKYLDYDGAYGNQCYDVFSQYNHDVVGGPNIYAGATGGARDIYEQYATNGAATHYARIPASTGPPQVGDVVVWGGTDSNRYGHVGVVTSVSDGGYTTLEQNTDGRASSTQSGAVTHTVSHALSSNVPLGYLRPTATT